MNSQQPDVNATRYSQSKQPDNPPNPTNAGSLTAWPKGVWKVANDDDNPANDGNPIVFMPGVVIHDTNVEDHFNVYVRDPNGHCTKEELKAIAGLIAAAPELYDALSALVEQFDVYRSGWMGSAWRDRIGLVEELNAARAAMKKARGEK